MPNPFLNTIMLGEGYLNGGGSGFIGKNVSPDSLPSTDYRGLLGKIIVIDDAEALKLSLTTTGTLRAGAYMRVQTKSGSSASPAKGIGAFWDTSANAGFGSKIVTPDISATVISDFAGVYVDAPSKGNYCWIQVGGLATLQCKASSVSSSVAGDVAIFTGLTTNTFDGIADATDHFTTAGAVKKYVGTWYEAPVADLLKLAWLKGTCIASAWYVG